MTAENDINLLPIISLSLSKNIYIQEDIEKIYSSNQSKYYILSKLSKYYNAYQDEQFNKCLGILIALNNESSLNKKFIGLIKKGWPYVYFYVSNRNNIEFKNFLCHFNKRYKSEDCYCDDFIKDNLLILLFLSESLDREIIIDRPYEDYINYLYTFTNNKKGLHTIR